MFYDIIQKESVDEHGNVLIELEAVTTAPVFDDLAPSDMSLQNQLKAGINMQIERGKVSDRLSSSDLATSQVVQNGEKLIEDIDTAQQIVSNKQQQQQQQQQPQQQQ